MLTLLVTLFLLVQSIGPGPITELQILKKIKVDIPEPSDICISPLGDHLYIVSDRGRLYKTTRDGEVIDRAKYKGADFEGICIVEDKLYVVDETLRMILEFDAYDLDLKDSKQYNYHGAMNRGWESIIYDAKEDRFIAFTEKKPLLLFEFDDDLDQKGVHRISDISEVSGATFHKQYIWAVSDEDRVLYKISPKSFKVKDTWRIPVLNPEGLAFTPEGHMLIISDDMKRIYVFKDPSA